MQGNRCVRKLATGEARARALAAAGLGSFDSAREAVRHLGYVQIDSIFAVERAHHHIIWSRVPSYRPAALAKLVERREVFEYWGHARAFLPIEDYRFCLPRMWRYRRGQSHWFEREPRVMRRVLARIRAEGPLRASDFRRKCTAGERKNLSQWYERTPEKRALEQLFMEGRLLVSRRDGFEILYDLPARVLPEGVDTRMPTPREHGRHLALGAIRAHGIASEAEAAYLQRGSVRDRVKEGFAALAREGRVEPVSVEGERYFIETGAFAAGAPQLRARILSPFDPLVIQRRRLQRLFGFDYQIECYVPAPKRRFGYFTLPVLVGERFAGRVELKADRAGGRLRCLGLWAERGIREGTLREALEPELAAFATFCGVGDRPVSDQGVSSIS